MNAVIKNLCLAVTELVFPARCPVCAQALETETGPLCPECNEKMLIAGPVQCDICGRPSDDLACTCLQNPPPFELARSVYLHQGPAADMIRGFKYGSRWAQGRAASKLLTWGGPPGWLEWADIVSPIALHNRRMARRGFNQAWELIKHLETRAEKIPELLIRTRNTPSQAGLDRVARSRNMRGAFVANARHDCLMRGKNILLIDDVFTTGHTAASASRALIEAGAARVRVLTLTRAMGHKDKGDA